MADTPSAPDRPPGQINILIAAIDPAGTTSVKDKIGIALRDKDGVEFRLWAPMMVAELMQEQIRAGCNQVIDAQGARGVVLRTVEALRPTTCDVLVSLAESIATVRFHSDAPASQNIALSLPQLRELARMLNAAADQIEATTTPRQ